MVSSKKSTGNRRGSRRASGPIPKAKPVGKTYAGISKTRTGGLASSSGPTDINPTNILESIKDAILPEKSSSSASEPIDSRRNLMEMSGISNVSVSGKASPGPGITWSDIVRRSPELVTGPTPTIEVDSPILGGEGINTLPTGYNFSPLISSEATASGMPLLAASDNVLAEADSIMAHAFESASAPKNPRHPHGFLIQSISRESSLALSPLPDSGKMSFPHVSRSNSPGKLAAPGGLQKGTIGSIPTVRPGIDVPMAIDAGSSETLPPDEKLSSKIPVGSGGISFPSASRISSSITSPNLGFTPSTGPDISSGTIMLQTTLQIGHPTPVMQSTTEFTQPAGTQPGGSLVTMASIAPHALASADTHASPAGDSSTGETIPVSPFVQSRVGAGKKAPVSIRTTHPTPGSPLGSNTSAVDQRARTKNSSPRNPTPGPILPARSSSSITVQDVMVPSGMRLRTTSPRIPPSINTQTVASGSLDVNIPVVTPTTASNHLSPVAARITRARSAPSTPASDAAIQRSPVSSDFSRPGSQGRSPTAATKEKGGATHFSDGNDLSKASSPARFLLPVAHDADIVSDRSSSLSELGSPSDLEASIKAASRHNLRAPVALTSHPKPGSPITSPTEAKAIFDDNFAAARGTRMNTRSAKAKHPAPPAAVPNSPVAEPLEVVTPPSRGTRKRKNPFTPGEAATPAVGTPSTGRQPRSAAVRAREVIHVVATDGRRARSKTAETENKPPEAQSPTNKRRKNVRITRQQQTQQQQQPPRQLQQEPQQEVQRESPERGQTTPPPPPTGPRRATRSAFRVTDIAGSEMLASTETAQSEEWRRPTASPTMQLLQEANAPRPGEPDHEYDNLLREADETLQYLAEDIPGNGGLTDEEPGSPQRHTETQVTIQEDQATYKPDKPDEAENLWPESISSEALAPDVMEAVAPAAEDETGGAVEVGAPVEEPQVAEEITTAALDEGQGLKEDVPVETPEAAHKDAPVASGEVEDLKMVDAPEEVPESASKAAPSISNEVSLGEAIASGSGETSDAMEVDSRAEELKPAELTELTEEPEAMEAARFLMFLSATPPTVTLRPPSPSPPMTSGIECPLCHKAFEELKGLRACDSLPVIWEDEMLTQHVELCLVDTGADAELGDVDDDDEDAVLQPAMDPMIDDDTEVESKFGSSEDLEPVKPKRVVPYYIKDMPEGGDLPLFPPLTSIDEFTALLADPALSLTEKLAVEESLVFAMLGAQAEYQELQQLAGKKKPAPGTAPRKSRKAAKLSRRRRNPFEPEKYTVYEAKKEAVLYSTETRKYSSRRAGLRNLDKALNPIIVPGYEHLPTPGGMEPKLTRGGRGKHEPAAAAAAASTRATNTPAPPQVAVNRPTTAANSGRTTPAGEPVIKRKPGRPRKDGTVRTVVLHPILPAPPPAAAPAPAAAVTPPNPSVTTSAQVSQGVLGIHFGNRGRESMKGILSRDASPDDGSGAGGPRKAVRGKTYKMPISVEATAAEAKPTMEEEFLAAQNADLGKRKRVRSALLVDGSDDDEDDEEEEEMKTPPVKKRRKSAGSGGGSVVSV